MGKWFVAALALCAGCGVFSIGDGARVADLRVNHQAKAHDVVAPTFSWKMDSGRRGAAQRAYRLRVWEGERKCDAALVRDTGVKECAESVGHLWHGPALKDATRYTWEVSVRDERGEWLAPAVGSFETGLSADGWKGSEWISAADSREATDAERKAQRAAPGTSCFAKSVANGKRVKEAWWTVTGLGAFEAYVNGKPVSYKCGARDALKPGFTHNGKTKHSFTYDVTHLVRTGAGDANVFSAMVSAGWWRDQIVKFFGKRSAFRAMLVLRYDDGTESRVGTDTTWLAGVGGPVLAASIFDGETYDARVKTPWMLDPAAGGFKPAVKSDEFKGAVVPMEGPSVRRRADLALAPVEAYVWRGVDGADANRFGKVKILRRYGADDSIVLEPGETLVVDFGQNAAAVPYFEARAAAGTSLDLRPAEMLNDGMGAKSRGNDGPEGSVYRLNLRAIWKDGAKCVYTFAGEGVEKYAPEFTFFGYRYVSATATGRVKISRLRSVPVTSVQGADETGSFTTSDADVNRLVSNVRWGMYSNYLSVPTDCPQRNERLGWTADTQVFCGAAAYNADVYGFLSKWMRDVRDTQHDNGSFTGVAPMAQYGSEAGERFGWADAGVIVPHTMWRRYGDRAIVDANWDAMAKYVDFAAATKFDTPVANRFQWADWLSFEDYESAGGGADKSRVSMSVPGKRTAEGKPLPRPETIQYWHFLGGCYWLWDAEMMRDMAAATDRDADAKKYSAMADDARKYLRANFLEKDGMLLKPFRANQCPALFAVKLKLLDEPALAATKAALIKNISDHGGCLTTGFLGTSILMDTLTYDVGAPEVAYSLLLQRKNPSWLYSVDQGATTIWERWNSYRKDTGFGPVGMNSFNHYAYGAVLSWMYGTMAGIREDLAAPGFRRFVLAPIPDRRIGKVDAAFDSPYGRIASAWEYRDGGAWRWRFTIPANTSALVTVPGETPREYSAGSYEITVDNMK